MPVKNNSLISDEYWKWLVNFDPDIIYSFIDINSDLIEAIGNNICPIKFQHVKNRYDINEWLKSVSIIPFIKRDYSSFKTPNQTTNFLSTNTDSRFLLDNFGSIFQSFLYSGQIALEVGKYFESLNITNQNISNNTKDFSIEEILLNNLSGNNKIISLSELSSINCQITNDASHEWNDSINIFIGDSFIDRLSFWNIYLSDYIGTTDYRKYSMIISLSYINNDSFITALSDYIKNVLFTRLNIHRITIRSHSLSEEKSNELIKKIESLTGRSSPIQFQKIEDENDCAKRAYYLHPVNSNNSNEQKWLAQFENNREFFLKSEKPDFLKMIIEDKYLQEGKCIVDFLAERHINYSEIINAPHYWRLPKRYNLGKLFFVNSPELSTRVNSSGGLSCAINISEENFLINLPNDEQLFRSINNANDTFPELDMRSKIRTEEYLEYEFSDKGLYLLQMFNLFGSVKNLFDFIECKFWRDQFKNHAAKGNIELVIKKLKKRLNGSNINTKDDKDLLKLANIFFKLAKDVKIYNDSFTIDKLEKLYRQSLEEYIENSQQHNLKEEKENILEEAIAHLDFSLRSLVTFKVLNQGYTIKCNNCGYKNWMPFEKLNALQCQICDRILSLPTRSPWEFYLNDNFATSIREHGIISQIRVLAKLCYEAKNSFYFIPPINIYRNNEEKIPYTDLDLFCVQDGKLIIGEIKTAQNGMGNTEKLLNIAQILKPDKVILACMDNKNKIIDDAVENLSNKLTALDKKYNPEVISLTTQDFLFRDESYIFNLPNIITSRVKVKIL